MLVILTKKRGVFRRPYRTSLAKVAQSKAHIGALELAAELNQLYVTQIAFSGQPRQLSRMFGDVNLEQAFLRCIGSDG